MSNTIQSKIIPISGYNICTYSVGDGEQVLLLLHGGPGFTCTYLLDSHQHFVTLGYRIVTYDQLGSGASDKPTDNALWQIDRFVEELELIRIALNLKNINIVGHSWGGILGLEYCLKYPQYVNKFIAVTIGFDVPQIQRGFERRKLSLGIETYNMMATHEAESTTTHTQYQAAITLLMYRHFCRLQQWPNALIETMNNIGPEPSVAMFGRYFFNCTGNLKTYNSLNRLPQLHIPTLLMASEYDYVSPELVCMAHDLLPNAQLHMFRNCSHTPFYEDKTAYTTEVINFLSVRS